MKRKIDFTSIFSRKVTKRTISTSSKLSILFDRDILTKADPQPVGPKDNEIWYWGEYYDLANAISSLIGQGGMSYAGPAVVSNEKVANKYVITFDGPVTKLGADMESREFYPMFINNSDTGITCNITSIEIPNSVTSIGVGAFQHCSGLTSVTIPNSVTSIGSSAFYNCTGLTFVTIPNSVTSIGNSAFWGCSVLTSINVASDNSNYCSVDGVLFNKDKTTLIQYPGGKQGAYTIPNSVTSIGENAFCECSSLTSVTIPSSVTSFGGGAFQHCSGLTSVTIPNSVTSIGGGAFQHCSGLTSVTCEATIPPTLDGTYVFDDTNNCPIYVPIDSVDAYKTSWSTYASRIQAIQD